MELWVDNGAISPADTNGTDWIEGYFDLIDNCK